MNDDNLDERLTQSLERQAAQVPARSHLTNAALKQASRIRARRRAGAVVASVAALAIAIPVGLQIFNNGRPNSIDVAPSPSTSVTASAPSPEPSISRSASPPAQSPSRSPSPSTRTQPPPDTSDPEPVRKRTWTFDFDELDRGPAPKVPYVDGRTVHDDGDTRRLGPNDRLLAVVGAGDLVWAMDPEEGTGDFVLVRRDGERVVLTEGDNYPEQVLSFAGVSDDGKRMAWSTSAGSSDGTMGSTNVTYANAETGKILNSGETHGALEAVGFVGDEVVLTSFGEGTMRWNGVTGRFTTWAGVQTVWATEPSSGLASLGRPSGMFPCAVVVKVSQPDKDLWRDCEQRIDTFSPDGEFGTSIHVRTDGLGPSRVRLVEARTNKLLVTLDDSLLTNPVWESDRAVLFSVYEGKEWAVVRCTVDRTCELAVEPRKGVDDEGDLYPVERR